MAREERVQRTEGGPDWKISGKTVCSIFEQTVRENMGKIYVASSSFSVTYGQAFVAVDRLATQIASKARGKVVGIFLPNTLSFLVSYHAVLRAGGQPALINIATPPASLPKILKNNDVAMVFATDDVPGFDTRTLTDAEVVQLSETDDPIAVTPARASADDTGVVLFSGGTTGLPKCIDHSHRAVIAKMERMEWGWPTNENETWLPVAPFSHVYGFLMGVVNPILRGGKLVLPDRFKPDLVVDLMAKERVTVFGGGPPAIYQALLAADNFDQADLSSLRVCPGGGAPFPVATHEAWEAATGLKIYEGLGMTEIAPLAVNQMSEHPRYGSVGRPCPGTDIEIVDVETGTRHMPAGQSGEIRVRGPHMMTGYHGEPEETAATMRDGFIYTGDIGFLSEDGFLTITDRKKDVIFHKGFNVFPREIEETLMGHEAVKQVCVVGRPDDRAGETPVAFVAGTESIDVADILELCQARLSSYKVPGEVHIIDQLPLTANGKPDRIALRARAKL